MKELIKEALSHGDFGGLQSFALVLFFVLLGAITVWVFWPGSSLYYQKIAQEALKGARDE